MTKSRRSLEPEREWVDIGYLRRDSDRGQANVSGSEQLWENWPDCRLDAGLSRRRSRVVDLPSVLSFDEETILDSVAETNRPDRAGLSGVDETVVRIDVTR